MLILSGRRERVESLKFSRCGRWLAATGFNLGLHIWDTANPTRTPHHPEEFPLIFNPTFRPDGNLFFCDVPGRCYLLDPATASHKIIGKISAACESFALSPDGERIFFVDATDTIRSWKFGPNGKIVKGATRKSDGISVVHVAVSPDGATLTTLEHRPDPHLVFRTTVSLKSTAWAKTYVFAQSPLFSSDGTRMIVYSSARLSCYEVANLEKPPRKALNPSRKHFLSMAFHPDGQLLTVDNDRLVQIWDVNTLTVIRTIDWKIGKLYAVGVSPDGTRAAVGTHTGKVLVWDWD